MAGVGQVQPAGGATVAVVGRPNVGKSTLVNRLAGGREAIVGHKPGVTRDRTAHDVAWRGQTVTMIDTGGWTPGWARSPEGLDAAITGQAEAAVLTADLVLLVVDATVGIAEEDAAVASWLRAEGADVVLVANKVDELGAPQAVAAQLAELYALGLGDPVPVSALHGKGSGDLLDVVWDRLRAASAFEGRVPVEDDAPGVALLGRPNVGKSSLFNRLLGERRVIVDERPGTTRDAVDTVIETPDHRRYRFIDTAGLRRKSRRLEATEYHSTLRTVQALDRAAAALLVIDAAEPIGEQEQRLARLIMDAGRALVVVLNKWDLTDEDRREALERERDRLLGFISFAPLVRTSATTGRGLDKLLPAVDEVLAQWRRRIPTAELNQWLADAVAAHSPPMHAGRPVRPRYITQVAAEPPTFRVFSTGRLSPSYLRYLERRLRESFGFIGSPLHIGVRVRPRWEEREGASGRPGAGSRGRKRRGDRRS
ncbi:MAG TPA: ribosome biogenesis GTPase Der [Egibacteraceae bacterium]|nr:ribosome biogenesis GTPase Der [Egibacteraceae bacterium]